MRQSTKTSTNLSKGKAIGEHLLLKYLESRNSEQQTKSGLIVKDSRNVKLVFQAEVISVGDKVTEDVKTGDTVVFKWFDNEDFNYNGEEYTFVNQDKILAIIN